MGPLSLSLSLSLSPRTHPAKLMMSSHFSVAERVWRYLRWYAAGEPCGGGGPPSTCAAMGRMSSASGTAGAPSSATTSSTLLRDASGVRSAAAHSCATCRRDTWPPRRKEQQGR
jgi:hypothetical protein